MKKIIRKYLFFFNWDNPGNNKDILIGVNLLVIFFIFLLYYFLYFTENSMHDLVSINSGFITFTLIRISILWHEIIDAKKIFSEVKIIYKERNWKYATIELYFITTIANYVMILITWIFVIDWNIVGSFGIKRSGFLGIIIVLSSIFQYRKFIKQEKRIRKPDRKKNHSNLRNEMKN